MNKLKWKYDNLLDSYEAKKYLIIRTYTDISKLYYKDEILRVCSSGGHNENITFAEQHHAGKKAFKGEPE